MERALRGALAGLVSVGAIAGAIYCSPLISGTKAKPSQGEIAKLEPIKPNAVKANETAPPSVPAKEELSKPTPAAPPEATPVPTPAKPEPPKPVIAKIDPPKTGETKPATDNTATAVKGDEKPAANKPTAPLPMFGGGLDRNMVNLTAKNIPEKPEPDGPDLLWKADLGSRAYGGPTIAHGKVLVGTNNERPRNPRDSAKNSDGDESPIDRGVLMCFNAADGKFLWQAVHNKLESGNVHDWPKEGVCATPTIEGNRAYYVSNRCTVVCVDLDGMANGVQGHGLRSTDPMTKMPIEYKDSTDADVIWEFDMMRDAAVSPHNMSAGCPLIVGDILYTVTGNGVDEGHINIPSPDAPSFIALNKKTGKLLWRSALPGKNIMHGQWSNPAYGVFGGVKTVIFPAGDGWVYGMTPDDGTLLWKFDANPKDSKYELGGSGTRSDFIGTPVIYDNKIYIGTGQDPEHFTGIAHFFCFDPAGKKGDISPVLVDKSEGGKVTSKPNPNSAVVWHYGGEDRRKFVPRDFAFGRTMSTACIVDGVLYISELQGLLHCLDAKTGKKFWQYDTKGSIWGSPYYADGKVYLATESGELFVFKHEPKHEVIDEIDNADATDEKNFRKKMLTKRKQIEAKYLLAKVEFDAAIRSTPVIADDVLYVMTEKSLYAFKKK